jgi:hypothetical protein
MTRDPYHVDAWHPRGMRFSRSFWNADSCPMNLRYDICYHNKMIIK